MGIAVDYMGKQYILLNECKHQKVDCEYEFLYNKFPFAIDFYDKIKDVFLWIMKIDMGDIINSHAGKRSLLC